MTINVFLAFKHQQGPRFFLSHFGNGFRNSISRSIIEGSTAVFPEDTPAADTLKQTPNIRLEYNYDTYQNYGKKSFDKEFGQVHFGETCQHIESEKRGDADNRLPGGTLAKPVKYKVKENGYDGYVNNISDPDVNQEIMQAIKNVL